MNIYRNEENTGVKYFECEQMNINELRYNETERQRKRKFSGKIKQKRTNS